MGGKGRRRRQKNYLAAHGGPTLLPPPPDPSKLDALPFKLRKLMSFSSPSPNDSTKGTREKKESNHKAGGDAEKRAPVDNDIKVEGDVISSDNENSDPDVIQKSGDEKKKRKRKRKQVKDLRFEKELEELEGRSKRKERKKKYREAKKKKHKKRMTEDTLEDFPKHEKIKFGEVVQAPPTLLVVPKAAKTAQNASKERLRLQAVEAYRNRKGWTSRPGLQFPPVIT